MTPPLRSGSAPDPTCIGCGRHPDEIDEYIKAVDDAPELYLDEADYVSRQEGTYNKANGHFLCTKCYIKAKMPSSPQGWKAP